ncbi:hypothetical protein [Streptomyces sp. NPDC052042]|uniref:hypothetical protein n=1 Tax=Streptomyces sp. NPDC052042 TaxID=3365683 RepID=UPI0037D0D6E9
MTGRLPSSEALPRIHGEIIFATPHGSRLYGFQTDSSDEDWLIVTDSRRPRASHTVRDGLDVVQIGWTAFLEHVLAGSHQSVEAAFSHRKLWRDARFRSHLDTLLVAGDDVARKYRRTIKAFCFGDFKRRRHAVRLAQNLSDLRRYGRFNPEMTQREAAFAGTLAENLAGNALAGILLAEF